MVRRSRRPRMHARPFQLPSVAFQLRHIARSLDRFCCYAEGTPLSQEQLAALAGEMERKREPAKPSSANWKTAWRPPAGVWTRSSASRGDANKIGRKGLPTTLAGLLIHAAEHTQRHVGQAITTAKVIVAQRT